MSSIPQKPQYPGCEPRRKDAALAGTGDADALGIQSAGTRAVFHAAIPALLPKDTTARRAAFALLRQVLSAAGEITAESVGRLRCMRRSRTSVLPYAGGSCTVGVLPTIAPTDTWRAVTTPSNGALTWV